MSGEVITITSGKGGVGKTTVTANLAAALAMLGKKVVAVDADIGLRNLDVVMGLENRIVYDLVDVVEGRCRLRQAMIKDKRFPDLHLVPAAQTRDKSAISPQNMIEICTKLRRENDYVLIDSPAGIERGFQNAIAPANRILIVTNPEHAAVRDADRIIGLIEAEEKGPAYLVVNRVKPALSARGDMLSVNDILDILAIELIGVVPEDEAILISSNRGLPVAMHNPNSTNASQAFRNLALRLNGQEVPYLDLQAQEFRHGSRQLTHDELLETQRRLVDNSMGVWNIMPSQESPRDYHQEYSQPQPSRQFGRYTDFNGKYMPTTQVEPVMMPARTPSTILFLKETVRSGRSIYHEGPVVIIGDVNPSAEIVASGDVVVWGKVRGLIHAGALGNTSAVICALDLSPTQLRIADQIAIPPEERNRPGTPEIAAIRDGQIVAEPWWK